MLRIKTVHSYLSFYFDSRITRIFGVGVVAVWILCIYATLLLELPDVLARAVPPFHS